MNGWIAVLLLLDLAGTAAAVVWAYRAEPLDGTPRDLARRDLRKVRYVEAGTDGALLAVVILGLHYLTFLSALGLAGDALFAGRACRIAVAFHTVLDDPIARRLQGRATLLAVAMTASLPLIVVVAAAEHSSNRTQAQRDSSTFGERIFTRERYVPVREVAHPPAAADAGLPDGIAVPVTKYQTGTYGQLVLLVDHDVTCGPVVVLLSRDPAQLGEIDVAVVYHPSALTRMPDGSLRGSATPTSSLPATASPSGAATPTGTPPADATASPSPSASPPPDSVCRTTAGSGIPVHSTIQITVPRDLLPPAIDEPNSIRDTGASGAAQQINGLRH